MKKRPLPPLDIMLIPFTVARCIPPLPPVLLQFAVLPIKLRSPQPRQLLHNHTPPIINVCKLIRSLVNVLAPRALISPPSPYRQVQSSATVVECG